MSPSKETGLKQSRDCPPDAVPQARSEQQTPENIRLRVVNSSSKSGRTSVIRKFSNLVLNLEHIPDPAQFPELRRAAQAETNWWGEAVD